MLYAGGRRGVMKTTCMTGEFLAQYDACEPGWSVERIARYEVHSQKPENNNQAGDGPANDAMGEYFRLVAFHAQPPWRTTKGRV